MLNLELGIAPEMMNNALERRRGASCWRRLHALGAHLLKELIE